MYTFATRALSLMLVVGVPVIAEAQGLPTTQPPYLLLIREDVKLGRGADHTKIEGGWVAAFEKAKSTTYYLAMESVTGSEAWFAIPAESYAAMGKASEAERTGALGAEVGRLRRTDAEVLNGIKTVVLRGRADLSTGAYPDLSKQRHWQVEIFQMRPGGEGAFEAIAKAYGAASKRSGSTIGYRVYEVAAGMPAPTFFVFASVTDFGGFDKIREEDLGAEGELLKGTDEKVLTQWTEKLMSSERFLLSLSPEMSYVPAEIRASDPAFWKKAPPMTKAATPTKPTSTQ